ncbi:MAG TPA: amidohydrolase family protein [Acidimicrobiales bacterium]
MAVLDQPVAAEAITYGIYDADEHYYEPEDAVSRHLEAKYRHAVRWIELDGRRTLLVNDRLLKLIPNPTYDPVGVPGSLESYFRGRNQEGKELRDLIEVQRIQPEYRDRGKRVAAMNAQGVDFAWLLPSLGLGLEEMLTDDTETASAVFRSYNRWLEEDWGYDLDGRIQTGPMITLLDPVAAEAELERVIELGARFITLRPAPVAVPGRPRSLGDPAHDRVWAMAAEAGVVVAFHAADSGYGRYAADWGDSGHFSGLRLSPFSEVLGIHIERPVFDTMAALVCHGVFDRHPTLRVATVELGAGWVPELFRRFRAAYGKVPQLFGRDPSDAFREHVWVAPFYEDDMRLLCDVMGVEHLLVGSDWPHPEGLREPRSALTDFAVLEPDEQRQVLRDNLSGLSGR